MVVKTDGKHKDITIKVGTPTTYLVGLDVGFGGLKYVSNAKTQPGVIPSAVTKGSPSSSRIFSDNDINLNRLTVSVPDGTFFVGRAAQNAITASGNQSALTQERNRAKDEISRVLFHTGIGLSLPDQDGEYDIHLITGVPNEDYETRIHRDLQEFLEGSFEVTFHISDQKQVSKKVNVLSVTIIRQPEGAVAYNQFALHPTEFVVAKETAKSYLGVIDIGQVTTDAALVVDGEINNKEGVNISTDAVSLVYRKLRSAIKKKFDTEFSLDFIPTDQDLDQALRTGKVSYSMFGSEQDEDNLHPVDEEIETCVEDVAFTIAKSVTEAWSNDMNRLEGIILGGGGAVIFKDALAAEFERRGKRGFTVVEAPQFSNVLGFYLYGVIWLGGQIGEKQAYHEYGLPVFGEEE